jgi:hypothetical protein
MTATPPDRRDADVTVIRTAVDDIGVGLAIWEHRTEPDAHARRCAADAVGAIDAALAGLYSIRARLVGETRAADDATAVRVDELLGRMRERPPGEREGGPAAELARPYLADPPPSGGPIGNQRTGRRRQRQ